MNRKITTIDSLRVFAILLALAFASNCSNNPAEPEPAFTKVQLSVTGYDSLSTELYEAWVVSQGTYSSLGKFNLLFNDLIIDTLGMPITEFASSADLSTASRIAITIEPNPDPNPSMPSAIEILTANITGATNKLSFERSYDGRAGNAVIITPSDSGGLVFGGEDPTNPYCGVWFISKPWGEPEFGMTILAPPTGWKYEGWLMHPTYGFISIGKFTDVTKADELNQYLDPNPKFVDTVNTFYHFPGEDFLIAPSSGPLSMVPFPIEVKTSMIFVTLEPEPDNSTGPFLSMTLFCKQLEVTMTSNTTYALDTVAMPFGTATLK